jgi:hypothetical protein
MPLFIAPYAARLSAKRNAVLIFAAVCSVSLFYLLTYAFPFERGLGIASYFPRKIAEFTKAKNLQGNLMNSYGFGGYLIWSLYPERKIFIDGRNEVYLPFMQKLYKARTDNRSWNKFLDDYEIQYALMNYIDVLEEVKIMGKSNKTDITYMPFSETHFPKSRWALIFWNDEGMVFIRRSGPNAKHLNLEYTSVYPEGENYHLTMFQAGKINRTRAVQELRRKLQEDPNCVRAQKLLLSTGGNSK